MEFLDLPWWAWLLILLGVWILLTVVDWLEVCTKAARDAGIKDALYEKRERYIVTETKPCRYIEYSFFGTWHLAEVSIVTQVEPSVIAFTDTEGRSFLVHTDEWREVHIPAGLENHADE